MEEIEPSCVAEMRDLKGRCLWVDQPCANFPMCDWKIPRATKARRWDSTAALKERLDRIKGSEDEWKTQIIKME